MGLGLALQVTHARQAHPPFARTYERTPVIVGRDNTVAACVLPDDKISRIHVSFDIREGYIVARDAGSTNGTYYGTRRIPTDRWVAVGPVNVTSELRIAEWILHVTTREMQAQAVASTGDFLVNASPPAVASSPDPGNLNATMASEPLRPSQAGRLQQLRTQINSGPGLRAARAWAQIMTLRNELVTVLAEAIESAPPAERATIARELLGQLPGVEREAGVRALLERNGVPVPHTNESASALALLELARWYVGQKPLANPNDIFAFARKLKTGIDELLLGILPMFSGLDRFEDQMALRGGGGNPGEMAPSSRLPRAPRDAARELFDWTDRTDDAIRAIRTDIVDLTMHQTAVLNGVMRGVKQLLLQLSPEEIEGELKTSVARRGALGRVFASFGAAADRWKVFRKRHGDLADEENEQFRIIFGPEFVAEYKSSSAEAGGNPNNAITVEGRPPVARR